MLLTDTVIDSELKLEVLRQKVNNAIAGTKAVIENYNKQNAKSPIPSTITLSGELLALEAVASYLNQGSSIGLDHLASIPELKSDPTSPLISRKSAALIESAEQLKQLIKDSFDLSENLPVGARDLFYLLTPLERDNLASWVDELIELGQLKTITSPLRAQDAIAIGSDNVWAITLS